MNAPPLNAVLIVAEQADESGFLTLSTRSGSVVAERDLLYLDIVGRGKWIPPGAMRTELRRINAIEELPDGRLRVLKRNVSGLDVHERLITCLAKSLYPVALTTAHNTNMENEGKSWILRVAATDRIRENDVSRLRRISADRLAEFVESIDDLFVAYETLHEGEESEPISKAVGVGVYYFEEDKSETDIFR